jgi:hypothetical protein
MLNLGVALKAAIFPSVGASSKSGAVQLAPSGMPLEVEFSKLLGVNRD